MQITQIENGSVTSPKGFTAGAAAAGLKADGGLDVALIVSNVDCTAAGVFTTNQVKAPPVLVDQATLAASGSRMRGIVANSKVANACTGEPGMEAARLMQAQAATVVGCETDQFFVLSTGVIGQQLPLKKIGAGIEVAASQLGANGALAAQAIMTTDTHPKHVAVQLDLPDGSITIGGMAKGAGMIHPNMATMLAVITTDAKIGAGKLQQQLVQAVNVSFNRISIDGDTSTNDTVLLLASGESGVDVSAGEAADAFQKALIQVCTQLSHMIVRDGEGVTKFVQIEVVGADSNGDAHDIANTIATSPLVKTAFAGSDANWGRMLAAAGRAGVTFDQYTTALWVSDDGDNWLNLLSGGTPSTYKEADAAAIFAEPDIWVRLRIGIGSGTATVWTCDLTHDYVTINADYRT